MTDIGRLQYLLQSRSPLPVRAYFDEALFEQEQQTIFANASIYVGNEKLVPEPGDWHRLLHEDGGRVLVRNAGGVELISNVCRHRQAIILGGQAGDVAGSTHVRGNLRDTGGNIVCPLHRWTYDSRGAILGAPHFGSTPCLNLPRFPLRNCHGSLFEGPGNPGQDLAAVFCRPEFDFSGYVPGGIEMHHCHYNWKTFIEVYLEDYHVGPFHPGLGRFVSCDDLHWEFGRNYSMQRVGVSPTHDQPGTDNYRRWHAHLMQYRARQIPDFGAIWVSYFPTHMMELYPHVLILSTLYPQSPRETLNVTEFYYPEDIALFEPDFVRAQQAAYKETMFEDDEIAERMDAGRRALLRRNTSESGPYQSPMEDGMQHFHGWYAEIMGQEVLDVMAAPA